ncbi:hypothetical protein HNY73_020866 [Argiope bruennichi]|uniref:Uncharacterized protein n=1 Tax=Argiope bruennichi TaxID=94029 RepID=A0A8T0E9K6_ARGBR|nr:hypothetical protein HNY73_020866 [Argiope bruennichi]
MHRMAYSSGPVDWSSQSSDISCRDCFFWGPVKALAYETPINSSDDFVVHIVATAGVVPDTPGTLANVRSSMRCRREACIMAQGRNFRHLR